VQTDARRVAELSGPLVTIFAGLVIGGIIISVLLALLSVSAIGF
jgi:type II secretory pathway component PulF